MNNNRLELLLQFYTEDPADPFNGYALAMEYQNKDRAKTKHYLDELLDKHPAYLPTYYHAAALYAALEKFERAEELYNMGMRLAIQQQNTKTYQELQRAHRQFLDDQEDW